MALNFPQKYQYLYDSKWDADKDSFFMNQLIRDLKVNPREKDANIPIASLRRATRGLNERFNQFYSWDDVCSRYAKLKDRYRTFKALIAQSGVYWDEQANSINASDELWYNICEKNELAKAYYHSGENDFDKLKLIFEMKDNKEFSWDKANQEENNELEEEVDSHLKITKSRGRLFQDASLDRLNFLPRRGFPPKPHFHELYSRKEKNHEVKNSESS